MYLPQSISILLFVLCFALSPHLDLWHQNWRGTRRTNVLSMLIGDSRRLFANHFFAKADAYFHGGYYPSIFDGPKPAEKSHMEESATEHHEGETEEEHQAHANADKCHEGETAEEHRSHAESGDGGFLEAPKDWIEAFGRNFFPSKHSHLKKIGDFREILPWLRLAAELDPQKIETYTVAAFTLRTRLDKPREAEEFLRDGLRANPDSHEILFEMGRLRDDLGDAAGARNLMELALKKIKQRQSAGNKVEEIEHAQVLVFLAQIEEREGNVEKAISYLKTLKEISPFKNELEKRIQELEAKRPGIK